MTRFSSLRSHLDFPATTPVRFSFEYAVDVMRGRGKPSYTDLMILAPYAAIAIEGKYTEPPYEEVGQWLRDPPKENRQEVLDGWLDLLRMATGVQLTVDSVLHLPYQLMHRAAYACWPPAIHRAVVCQVFAANDRDSYITNLRMLRNLLPTSVLRFAVLETPAIASNCYANLLARWDQGGRRMAHAVRAALIGCHIFNFAEDFVVML
jgi:hypothetical protein